MFSIVPGIRETLADCYTCVMVSQKAFDFIIYSRVKIWNRVLNDITAMQASGLDIPKIALSVTFSRDISIPEIVERAFWHSPHIEEKFPGVTSIYHIEETRSILQLLHMTIGHMEKSKIIWNTVLRQYSVNK